MPFLDDVARDMLLSNPHATLGAIKAFIERCNVWQYEWGIIFADGNDVHWHILTDYRKRIFLRKPLREATKMLFSKYPVIKTSILKSKPHALDYDLRMGWKIVNETESSWLLEMKKMEFKYEL